MQMFYIYFFYRRAMRFYYCSKCYYHRNFIICCCDQPNTMYWSIQHNKYSIKISNNLNSSPYVIIAAIALLIVNTISILCKVSLGVCSMTKIVMLLTAIYGEVLYKCPLLILIFLVAVSLSRTLFVWGKTSKSIT